MDRGHSPRLRFVNNDKREEAVKIHILKIINQLKLIIVMDFLKSTESG